MIKHAEFSQDRIYRFSLLRQWEVDEVYKSGLARRIVNFICLNPSTADEMIDDPTIRRCIQFASDWGYGGFVMTNLFALRSTSPEYMKQQERSIGEGNNGSIKGWADRSSLIVLGWGNHGSHMGRDKEVLELLRDKELWCFKQTKLNQPQHPLYMAGATQLIRYGDYTSPNKNSP